MLIFRCEAADILYAAFVIPLTFYSIISSPISKSPQDLSSGEKMSFQKPR